MGNTIPRGLVHRSDRRIRIMRADGTVMKLRSPVCVKEILIDYPNHGIFEAPAGLRFGMGSFTLPLSERVGLLAGHLYYLIPLPIPHNELINYNSRRWSFARTPLNHSIPNPCFRLQTEYCADIGRDSVEQEAANCAVNKINRGGVKIVSSSFSTDGSTVRVKLRLRREDLAAFLSALPPGATRESPWKPRLDPITEAQNPGRDL